MSAPTELTALGGHSQAHAEATFWVALALFAAVVVVLIVLYRRSQRSVEMEEIDALLRQEDVI